MDYPDVVLRHFDAPDGAGPLQAGPGRVASGDAGSLEQGTHVVFSVRAADDRVAAIAFRAFGCPYTIAACSLAAQRLTGGAVGALGALGAGELAAALQAPRDRMGRLLVVEDALRKCLSAWENALL